MSCCRAAWTWGGWTEAHYPNSSWNAFGAVSLEQNIRHIRGVLAGYVAEQVFGLALEGSRLDERTASICMAAMAAASKSGTFELLNKIECGVAEDISRNRDKVEAVAGALVAVAPNKVRGLAEIIGTPVRKLGKAEARRLRQMQRRS